ARPTPADRERASLPVFLWPFATLAGVHSCVRGKRHLPSALSLPTHSRTFDQVCCKTRMQ
ncbi:hypothetical protein, partial [Xanthomonas arboricola]|uniref:hypothetical protein n=1 Tax=Xanthomonas arboricola TaxID=56448 RepID=UPI001C6154EB